MDPTEAATAGSNPKALLKARVLGRLFAAPTILKKLFWGLIIVGLVALIRWLLQSTSRKGHSGVSTGSKTINILKERYARGEIARDEFESMKKDII